LSLILDPVASAGPIAHADWLELTALQAADRGSSYQDLVAALTRSGSIDGLPGASVQADRGSQLTQQVADTALAEIRLRSLACDGAYPFELGDQGIAVKGKASDNSTYVFMLLLREFGVKGGPRKVKGASHFEELSAEAGRRYLGGDANDVESYHFGFPRRTNLKNFVEALNEMCARIGDGGGANSRTAATFAKDGKLDLVVWRHFPDKRPGKLIAFGQCAAGKSYEDKITELIPRRFVYLWISQQIVPDPLNFFFIPGCVGDEDLTEVISAQAILFDRCRIAALLEGGQGSFAGDLKARTSVWTDFMLKKLRKD
jgi:hypothetical protein